MEEMKGLLSLLFRFVLSSVSSSFALLSLAAHRWLARELLGIGMSDRYFLVDCAALVMFCCAVCTTAVTNYLCWRPFFAGARAPSASPARD